MKTILFILLMSFTGCCFGSFICCMVYRKINKESPFVESHCDFCQQKLKLQDLIPVVSYAVSKGKCRYCRTKLPIAYPAAELLSAIIFIINITQCESVVSFIERTAIEYLLFYLALYDEKTCLIDEWVIAAGIILRSVFFLIYRFTVKTMLNYLFNGLELSLTVLSVSLVMKKIMKKEVLGTGDILLLFMIGIYNSYLINHLILLFACLIQMAVFIRQKKKEQYLPFAPAVFLGFLIVTSFQKEILSVYQKLFLLS